MFYPVLHFQNIHIIGTQSSSAVDANLHRVIPVDFHAAQECSLVNTMIQAFIYNNSCIK